MSTVDETWGLDMETTAWPEERNEGNIDPEPSYLVSARKTGLYSDSEEDLKAWPECRVEDLKTFHVRGVDEFGLLTLLRGVHLGSAPREMPTATLGRLLVATECFMCDVPRDWVFSVWFELYALWREAGYELLLRHPRSITRPLVALLYTSQKVLNFDLFRMCVARVIRYADGRLTGLGLFLPQALIGK